MPFAARDSRGRCSAFPADWGTTGAFQGSYTLKVEISTGSNGVIGAFATLPYTMTGVRQAIGRGIVGVVAAEFFLSATRLGQVIMLASQNFDTAAVFAMILVIGLLGVPDTDPLQVHGRYGIDVAHQDGTDDHLLAVAGAA